MGPEGIGPGLVVPVGAADGEEGCVVDGSDDAPGDEVFVVEVGASETMPPQPARTKSVTQNEM